MINKELKYYIKNYLRLWNKFPSYVLDLSRIRISRRRNVFVPLLMIRYLSKKNNYLSNKAITYILQSGKRTFENRRIINGKTENDPHRKTIPILKSENDHHMNFGKIQKWKMIPIQSKCFLSGLFGPASPIKCDIQ